MDAAAHKPIHPHHVHQRHFDRLVMLSDGVFAIAMTLSAVELKPEAQPGANIAEMWARPLATYFVSFAIISGVWIRHRSALAHLRRVDTLMTVISLLLLSLVALMPVVIRQMLEGGAEWNSVGLLIYSLALMANYTCLTVGWGYAAFVAKLAPDVSRPRALAWLMKDLFVAVLFGALALYSMHLKVAAALATLLGVAVRIASMRQWKLASLVETEAPAGDIAGQEPSSENRLE